MKSEEYEQIFNSLNLPAEIRLSAGVYIKDVSKFIESHLIVLKSTDNERQKELHSTRLDQLINLIKGN